MNCEDAQKTDAIDKRMRTVTARRDTGTLKLVWVAKHVPMNDDERRTDMSFAGISAVLAVQGKEEGA